MSDVNDINAALTAFINTNSQKTLADATIERMASLKGEPGEPGQRGADGKPAVVKIGDVSVGTPNVRCEPQSDNRYVLHITLPPGIKGDTGAAGRTGDAGRPIDLRIGTVVSGDDASAVLRVVDNVHFLDLVLPRAKDGERGADGLPGRNGVDGAAGRNGRDGIDGQSIVGPRGEKGEPGLTPEEIQTSVVEALQSAGLGDAMIEKMVRTKLALRQAQRNCTTRHIAELSDIVRKVENIFDGNE